MDKVPNNLPFQVSTFIGRQREVAEIRRLLDTSRLVTLTGAGGCGKTRLALEVASASCGDVAMEHLYGDGVWFVALAALADPALLLQQVASSLDLREQSSQPLLTTLINYLHDKKVLLILDNCEHLIAACAQLADRLLRTCSGLRLLATSREALNVAGEHIYLVSSLEPDPAVRLFVERATATQAHFALDDRNVKVVMQICRQLDGIPLAIELAAARLTALSLEQIAARLDNVFQLLTGGHRTALPRHQTLRAAMDWSYDLLSEPECALLRRLSVFAGSWTLEAAEALYVDEGTAIHDAPTQQMTVLDLLNQLVNKSLVQMDRRHAETRYQMLETIRLYAHERLVDASEFEFVVTRHVAAFARLAAEAEPRLKGPEQLAWLSRLEGEHDNLRVALACDAAEVPARLHLAINLSWFWNLHSHLSEGRRWLHDLMERYAASPMVPADDVLDASARLAAGSLAYVQDDYLVACSLLVPAIRRFRMVDDRRSLASALNYFGMSAYWQGRKDEAQVALDESASLFRRVGDPWGLAVALHSLDSLAFDEQDSVTVQRLNEESQTLLRQTGDRWALAMPLGSLGKAAEQQGDWRLAEKYLSESLAIQREFSDRQGIAWTLLNLASVALRSGDSIRAEDLCTESLTLYRALNNRGNMIGGALLLLGHIALQRGAYAQASAHFGETLALARAIDDKPHLADSLSGLGNVSLAQGDLSQAASYYWEAMQTRRIVGHRVAIAFAFQDFALLAAMQDQAEAATKLFAASQVAEVRVRELRYPRDRAAHDHALHQLREKLGRRFDELWAAGQALTLENAVAEAKCLAAAEQTGPLPTQPAPAYPSELTAREVDVLRLLARGLTNAQIADQLVISPRTVNAHLRSIYSKLGVTTRTAAARFATEQKLD